jgi:hypothetical protein
MLFVTSQAAVQGELERRSPAGLDRNALAMHSQTMCNYMGFQSQLAQRRRLSSLWYSFYRHQPFSRLSRALRSAPPPCCLAPPSAASAGSAFVVERARTSPRHTPTNTAPAPQCAALSTLLRDRVRGAPHSLVHQPVAALQEPCVRPYVVLSAIHSANPVNRRRFYVVQAAVTLGGGARREKGGYRDVCAVRSCAEASHALTL